MVFASPPPMNINIQIVIMPCCYATKPSHYPRQKETKTNGKPKRKRFSEILVKLLLSVI